MSPRFPCSNTLGGEVTVPSDAIASGNRLSRYRIKEWAHNHVLDCLVSIFRDAVQAITLTPRMSLQLPLVRVSSWGTCTFTMRSWLPFVGSSLTLPSFMTSRAALIIPR